LAFQAPVSQSIVFGIKTPKTRQNSQNSAITTADYIKNYVLTQAKAENINPIIVSYIVSHESQWRSWKTGDDGNSRGLWQISKIYHPEVSDVCAYDYRCSTLWSLNWIKKGNIGQWSTFKEYCTKIEL
jgi:hypothetical protein